MNASFTSFSRHLLLCETAIDAMGWTALQCDHCDARLEKEVFVGCEIKLYQSDRGDRPSIAQPDSPLHGQRGARKDVFDSRRKGSTTFWWAWSASEQPFACHANTAVKDVEWCQPREKRPFLRLKTNEKRDREVNEKKF
jgi:hypothetical protein